MGEITIMYTPDKEDRAFALRDILKEFFGRIYMDRIDGRDTLWLLTEEYGYDEESIEKFIRDLVCKKSKDPDCRLTGVSLE